MSWRTRQLLWLTGGNAADGSAIWFSTHSGAATMTIMIIWTTFMAILLLTGRGL